MPQIWILLQLLLICYMIYWVDSVRRWSTWTGIAIWRVATFGEWWMIFLLKQWFSLCAPIHMIFLFTSSTESNKWSAQLGLPNWFSTEVREFIIWEWLSVFQVWCSWQKRTIVTCRIALYLKRCFQGDKVLTLFSVKPNWLRN